MARCERCGADLPERARFCPSCGAPAEPAAPTAAERKLATVVFEEEATPLLELHGTYIVPSRNGRSGAFGAIACSSRARSLVSRS